MLLNRLPHRGLGGLAPQQVAMLGGEPLVKPVLGGTELGPQALEDLMDALQYTRAITAICGETDEVLRKVAFDAATKEYPVRKGDWHLVWYGEREDALQSFFRGPYVVTDEGTGGFCTVAPLLAGNVLGDKLKRTCVAALALQWGADNGGQRAPEAAAIRLWGGAAHIGAPRARAGRAGAGEVAHAGGAHVGVLRSAARERGVEAILRGQ